MIIAISTDGVVQLEDAENFKQFKIVVPVALAGGQAVVDKLGALGVLDKDGAHVWVSIAEFLTRFGAERPADWHQNFNRMVESVAKHGYVDADRTAVRSHIEAI